MLVPGLPDTEYTPRGVAIGLKNGTSLLFDTDRLSWLAAWRGGFAYRTKSGRLWEWHPETPPFWVASRRLPPVVLLARDGSVQSPRLDRERFGSFRVLEFVGDGVRLTYRLDFEGASVSVSDSILPVENGWDRTVRVSGIPDGQAAALVEQPGVELPVGSSSEWNAGALRIRLSWPPEAGPLVKVPDAGSAFAVRLKRAGATKECEGTVSTRFITTP
jgi:hypothetical protein